MIVALVTVGGEPARAANACREIYAGVSGDLERAIENLAHLRFEIDTLKSRNVSEAHVASLEASYRVKFYELRESGSQLKLFTAEDLSSRVRTQIGLIQLKRAGETTSEKTAREKEDLDLERAVIDGSRVILYPIAPGSFGMGPVGNQVQTRITKPFSMASTLTTQVVWRKIVDLARREYPASYELLISKPAIQTKDLHPVEKVTFFDVQRWLAAANRLLKDGNREALDLFPQYVPGSSLRLPTEAEWEFVARARGHAQGIFYFGDDESELGQHAWYQLTSGFKTHPVAEKSALIVSGNEFYDIYGNVQEMVSDWFSETLRGGDDPDGPLIGSARVIRSSGRFTVSNLSTTSSRGKMYSGNASSSVGFRIVLSRDGG